MNPLPGAEPGLSIQVARNHTEKEGPSQGLNRCSLTCRILEVRLPEELPWGSPKSFPWSKQLPSMSHSHLTLHQLTQSAASKATTQRLHVASYFTKALMNPAWKAVVSSLQMQTQIQRHRLAQHTLKKWQNWGPSLRLPDSHSSVSPLKLNLASLLPLLSCFACARLSISQWEVPVWMHLDQH